MVCSNCVFFGEYKDHGASIPVCFLCDNLTSAEKACKRDIKCAYFCTMDELKQYVYIREKLKIIREDSSFFSEIVSKILDK